MADRWGEAIFAARRRGDETTRESAFVYTNSNNTKGEGAIEKTKKTVKSFPA